jgi:hypothetical protein
MKKKIKIAALTIAIALLGLGVFAISEKMEGLEEEKAAETAEAPAAWRLEEGAVGPQTVVGDVAADAVEDPAEK